MTDQKKRILLAEDEPHLAFNLNFNLQREGYEVIPATNGQVALDLFRQSGPFDLVVLDVMMPEINGFDVARTIRKTDGKTGILMLTAKAAEDDIITGLECGADDYMTKPFHLKEFLLRVKRMAERSSLLRTNQPNVLDTANLLSLGSLTLNIDELVLHSPDAKETLTALEAQVLAELIHHVNRVVSRRQLLEKVWGLSGSIETRTVDNFIMRLRKVIERHSSCGLTLESVRGRGYRLKHNDESNKA